MVLAHVPLLLALGMTAPSRPALGSPHLRLGNLPGTVQLRDTLPDDGWRRRGLIDTTTGEVRVRGPERPVPTRVPGDVVVSEAEALATIAALGWDGATSATLVLTRRGVPAWRVDPPASLRWQSNPVFLVDARTGRAWLRHDRARTESVGAFAINPVVTPRAESFELVDFDPNALSGDLAGERLAVFNCVPPEGAALCGYESIAASNRDGDFLHPAPDVSVEGDNVQLLDPFAGQSVYHHADSFLVYLDALGVPPLGCLPEGTPLVLLANYKAYLAEDTALIGNATYLGSCELLAAFGQGPTADYGYDGDVVIHELGHGVVEALLGGATLGRSTPREDAVLHDAGAINEGTADFFAAVVTGNSEHAEYVASRTGVTARNADNTLQCPAAITGEVHADGELWSGALWDAYAELGDPMIPTLLDAISLLPDDATFDEAATVLRDVAAEQLGAEAGDTVQAALAGHGLFECPRITPWDELTREIWLRPRGQGGKFRPLQPAPLQLAVDLPADATGFRLRFAVDIVPTAGFAPDTELHALVSAGEPLSFAYEEDDEGFTNVLADPDSHLPAIEAEATGDGVLVEAEGGQTVYIGLFNQSASITIVSAFDIEVVFEAGEDETGADGGSDDGGTTSGEDGTGSVGGGVDSDDGGCACRTTPGRFPSALWLLGLVVTRRRRAAGRR